MTRHIHFHGINLSKIFVYFQIIYIISWLEECRSLDSWSQTAILSVPDANQYSHSPSLLYGRGYQALISGYDTGTTTGTPGVFVHTNDYGFAARGYYCWTQTAKLTPADGEVGDDFGKWMGKGGDQSLLVSTPNKQSSRGAIYIFNGTLRHWSQQQRLLPDDGGAATLFGENVVIHNDRMIISATGAYNEMDEQSGAAYIYERNPGEQTWSRQSKLVAHKNDMPVNLEHRKYTKFSQAISLHGDLSVVSAKNDNNKNLPYYSWTGGVYIFKRIGTQWSQQQKLWSTLMQYYRTNDEPTLVRLEVALGNRSIGRSVGINNDAAGTHLLVGVNNLLNDVNDVPNKDSIYIFKSNDAVTKWSQQADLSLFKLNESTSDSFGPSLLIDKDETMIATFESKVEIASYIFKQNAGTGAWSEQQRLVAHTLDDVTDYNAPTVPPRTDPPDTAFSNPSLQGGNLFYTGNNELVIRSQFRQSSCLLIWMADHFRDGWDSAVLTVRSPDKTNDTFYPHCNEPDPFFVRYCPWQPEQDGLYIIKVFGAIEARFFWEISWKVLDESSGQWYLGDYATTMHFDYSYESNTFTLAYSENLVNLDAACYRCTTITVLNWAELQALEGSAFWPLRVSGAPYYISNAEGREIFSSGKVCGGKEYHECYQTLDNGVYILRLGAGLHGGYGGLTGFPHWRTARWEGCGGESGGYRDQLIFRISDGVCTPIQKFHYGGDRCAKPPLLTAAVVPDAPFLVDEVINTFGDRTKPILIPGPWSVDLHDGAAVSTGEAAAAIALGGNMWGHHKVLSYWQGEGVENWPSYMPTALPTGAVARRMAVVGDVDAQQKQGNDEGAHLRGISAMGVDQTQGQSEDWTLEEVDTDLPFLRDEHAVFIEEHS